jgi:tyrosyl-tRNA synthetase
MHNFLEEMRLRGFIYQESDAKSAETLIAEGPQLAYGGFDCTATSLHVGNLMLIMLMRRWQQAGHRPIILLGGATTLIGDPSGKDQTRQLLTAEQVQANKTSLIEIFKQFLDFDDQETGALIVDNHDWWKDKSYLEVLRTVGSLVTINRMLTFESVQRRLEREQPLTFLEFNYMILQGYDFVHLFNTYQCRFQFGGSDQWGNMISGLELARKMGLPSVHVVTMPLLMTSAGTKMGKTEQGAVWLKKDHLSDYDYWQFWRNCDDRDVERFLKIFTDLSLEQIAVLMSSDHEQALNNAKIVLANEQTRLCRGLAAQEAAYAQAQALFSHSTAMKMEFLPRLSLGTNSCALTEFLVKQNLVASKTLAKTLIRQGGVKLQDHTVVDEFLILEADKLADGWRLSVGKKKHYLIVK